MQHKYPFVVLMITMAGEEVDVNVHPAKMEIRFQNQQAVYNAIYEAVDKGLHAEELIPQVELDEPAVPQKGPGCACSGFHVHVFHARAFPGCSFPGKKWRTSLPSRLQCLKKKRFLQKEERDLDYFMAKMRERVRAYHDRGSQAEVDGQSQIYRQKLQADRICETAVTARKEQEKAQAGPATETKQLDLFEEKFLDREVKAEYKLIGQVFDTYWMVQFQDNLYIIDQHAAHERVLYERTLKSMKTREYTSQMISPPIILDLGMQEAALLREYMDRFTRIGFEFEEFGQDSFAVRAVPDNLFSIAKKELLMQMLDSLSDEVSRNLSADLIDEKVASMSCKAAVKGKMKLSAAEVDTLIGELLTLKNPYHCPHGRPTIIAMSKRELEKKFKRIV